MSSARELRSFAMVAVGALLATAARGAASPVPAASSRRLIAQQLPLPSRNPGDEFEAARKRAIAAAAGW